MTDSQGNGDLVGLGMLAFWVVGAVIAGLLNSETVAYLTVFGTVPVWLVLDRLLET